MGQPQRTNRAPIAIALAVIAGFVAMVMIGIAVLAGFWIMRASTFEEQMRRERAMAEEQRQLMEQLNQAMLEGTKSLDDVSQLQRHIEEALEARKSDAQVGVKLKAERPQVVDDVEIVEVMEGGKVKIRWLSGQPGEEVIPLDRLRSKGQ
jgi:hypothetical protein